MAEANDSPSQDRPEANELGDPPSEGGSTLKDTVATFGGFLIAVAVVGGVIYALLRDAGTLRAVSPPVVATPAAPQEPVAPKPLLPSTNPADAASGNSAIYERARAERCKQIEEAVRQNEQTARLPQPGWRQDRLTAEKRQLLDEKHSLSC